VPQLVVPTTTLHAAWLDARDDWGRGVHQDGSGLRSDDDVDSPTGFASWVARLHAETAATGPTPDGRVPCSSWWVVEDGRVVGSIALRRELNAFLADAGGHIGYSVRPSERRRGLAGWALGEVLQHAADLGLQRVLITCDVDNTASARTVERHGGVLDDVRDTVLGRLRRYWVELDDLSARPAATIRPRDT